MAVRVSAGREERIGTGKEKECSDSDRVKRVDNSKISKQVSMRLITTSRGEGGRGIIRWSHGS